MNFIKLSLIASLVVVLFFTAFARAQDDDEEDTRDAAVANAAEDVEAASGARAVDEDEDDGDVEEADEEAEDLNIPFETPFVCKAFFANSTSPVPTFHAGSPATTTIVFQNNAPAPTTVVLAVGHLQPKYDYQTILRNFSVVRHARVVRPKESNTFRYSFTPDVYLEAGEYNLIIGLYFQDSSTNNTLVITAYNSTVFIAEPTGADPRMILTYFTLLAIVGGVGYYFANRAGLIKMIKSKKSAGAGSSSGPSRGRAAVSGNSGAIDPDYISAEHRAFREEVLKRKNKTQSASPNKKK